MSLCIGIGGRVVALALEAFTLSWTHSVERTEWREDWRLTQDGLAIVEARVRGSGAGMEPGEDARLQEGWWVWHPSLPPQRTVTLAASGATGAGWTLCHPGGCLDLGAQAGEPVRLSICTEEDHTALPG